MGDFFLMKRILHALIGLIIGFLISWLAFSYIGLRIYQPGHSLVLPVIILVLGVGLAIFSSYRIFAIGKENNL
ncbi:hypothetical protein [Commensalibacter oyaizuii]|uniref:Uncharacterized protein n=1 Tax=Commensalibacter oyaizuii TaxID=3043873 RepID=A0ABT6Q1T6_9PROT|nr:hypothetical protein [Commensalibacter sp. TBRC 16381]MDI2091078.1 hypothetical protein [Commensalibacter sp. TBRC 16381]